MILQKCFVFQDKPISSIETGKYNPSLELAFAISDFFGNGLKKSFSMKEVQKMKKSNLNNRDTICSFRCGLFDCCAVD